MQAFVFGLATPLLPLFLRKLYKKEETLSARELFFRYVVYTFLKTVFTAFVMVFLCDEGTSFLGKVDASPGFALKYLLIQLFGAAALAGLEWAYETRRLAVTVDRESFEKNVLFRICRKVLSLGIYLLAALTAVLNATLLFDNVLWGDEAYSANLMRNNLKDMMQIITLEEPHPPLYYLWLKMWVELLGKNGAVYHAASFFLFLIGAVLAVTLLRKRYGKIPASFFLVVTGMSAMGLTYNVEIRMYAMACLGVTFCYYCAGRVLKQNRFLSWAGMVFWALVAAYSHYFALLAAVVTLTALREENLDFHRRSCRSLSGRVCPLAAIHVQGGEPGQGKLVAGGVLAPEHGGAHDIWREQYDETAASAGASHAGVFPACRFRRL